MNILLINGSPNKEGNTAFLLSEAEKIFKKNNIDSKIIYLQEALLSAKTPFCVCCSNPCNKSCYEGTKMEDVLKKAENADAIIFGSPVYFGTMSAQLKCFFDKTRDLRGRRALVGKIGCAFSCGASLFGGQESTIRAIQDAMLVDGMTLVGSSSISLGAGHLGVAALRPANEDKNALSRIELICDRIICELKKGA